GQQQEPRRELVPAVDYCLAFLVGLGLRQIGSGILVLLENRFVLLSRRGQPVLPFLGHRDRQAEHENQDPTDNPAHESILRLRKDTARRASAWILRTLSPADQSSRASAASQAKTLAVT